MNKFLMKPFVKQKHKNKLRTKRSKHPVNGRQTNGVKPVLKIKVQNNPNLFKFCINIYQETTQMTEATLDIRQWGNNLCVRLPASVYCTGSRINK